MSRIYEIVTREPQLKRGMNGNYYIISSSYSPLERICNEIGKSPRSIYFNSKHGCYVVRIRSSKHKQAIKEYWEKSGI